MSEPDTYIESQIIMTTVQVVAPFALAWALYTTLHGADSPGGGFQGGAIIGSVVLMIAFAFGIEVTRDWLANRTVVAMVGGGTVAFVLVGLIPLAFGGSFLEHRFYEAVLGIPDGTKWSMEAIEVLGVAAIVAGAVIGLFFLTATGFLTADTDEFAADGGERE